MDPDTIFASPQSGNPCLKSSPSGVPDTFPTLRVLLVDDHAEPRASAKKGLEGLGFSVEAVSDGDEAFRRATAASYDALVIDVLLAGRDGLSILRGLREQRNQIPVILFTARAISRWICSREK